MTREVRMSLPFDNVKFINYGTRPNECNWTPAINATSYPQIDSAWSILYIRWIHYYTSIWTVFSSTGLPRSFWHRHEVLILNAAIGTVWNFSESIIHRRLSNSCIIFFISLTSLFLWKFCFGVRCNNVWILLWMMSNAAVSVVLPCKLVFHTYLWTYFLNN